MLIIGLVLCGDGNVVVQCMCGGSVGNAVEYLDCVHRCHVVEVSVMRVTSPNIGGCG
jgi:hypothetical protein